MKITLSKSILLIAAFAMIFAGCKKNEKHDVSQTPNPGTSKIKFYYTVSNQDVSSSIVGSDCFHFNFSYKDAEGNMVEVNNAELPWTKTITVDIPFEAILEGTITYDEADMPDDVYFIKNYQVSISSNSPLETTFYHDTKDNIITLLNNDHSLLRFRKSFTYNDDRD